MLYIFTRIFIFFVVIGLVILFISMVMNEAKKEKKNLRNFKVRFDPASNMYYIVNEFKDRDEPIRKWYGSRVMYKDKVQAEFVKEKLNDKEGA